MTLPSLLPSGGRVLGFGVAVSVAEGFAVGSALDSDGSGVGSSEVGVGSVDGVVLGSALFSSPAF